jgi:hypothetical protein
VVDRGADRAVDRILVKMKFDYFCFRSLTGYADSGLVFRFAYVFREWCLMITAGNFTTGAHTVSFISMMF